MTTNERVDVTAAVRDARREAERCTNSDHAYAELMATYAEMGQALDEDPPAELEAHLQDLWSRINVIGKRYDEAYEQAWALWCSRNMDFDRGAGA